MNDLEKALEEYGPEGDAQSHFRRAVERADQGRLSEAAVFLDRAHCISPTDESIAALRAQVLDRLAIVEHGIEFRYIPGGTFLMGSENGDPDEKPLHPVFVSPFWMAAVPASFECVCDILDLGKPPDIDFNKLRPMNSEGLVFPALEMKIIWQYCEDETLETLDWHSHYPGRNETEAFWRRFPPPRRQKPDSPDTYRQKPIVAMGWRTCNELLQKLTTKSGGNGSIQYSLPSEAEWEKAARGGIHGMTYSWGNEPPHNRADCDRFVQISILPSRTFPPNDYGLFSMCGGVWEWTRDWYDAQYYSISPSNNPQGPETGKEKVMRGGSWSDCPEACTVSFRMSQVFDEKERYFRNYSPNHGFRICRRDASPDAPGAIQCL